MLILYSQHAVASSWVGRVSRPILLVITAVADHPPSPQPGGGAHVGERVPYSECEECEKGHTEARGPHAGKGVHEGEGRSIEVNVGGQNCFPLAPLCSQTYLLLSSHFQNDGATVECSTLALLSQQLQLKGVEGKEWGRDRGGSKTNVNGGGPHQNIVWSVAALHQGTPGQMTWLEDPSPWFPPCLFLR